MGYKGSIFLLVCSILNNDKHMGKKYRFVVIGKRMLCRCGCYGRCCNVMVFRVVAWSIKALLSGYMPNIYNIMRQFRK